MHVIKRDDRLLNEALRKFSERRVAIYCRVSKSNNTQNSSIECQVDSLMHVVKEHPKWVLIEIYSDKKSGLNIKKRENFKRMINDCLGGKIDIVLTKSMSRFSRNTVDILNVVRMLKDKGVEVMFEIEKFSYEERKAVEFEIRAAMNEEESIQKSKDIRWGIKKRQRKGQYTFNANNLLGYRKTEEGKLEIVEEQNLKDIAWIELVKRMQTPSQITDILASNSYISSLNKYQSIINPAIESMKKFNDSTTLKLEPLVNTSLNIGEKINLFELPKNIGSDMFINLENPLKDYYDKFSKNLIEIKTKEESRD